MRATAQAQPRVTEPSSLPAGAAMPSSASDRPSLRRVLATVHLWIGLVLCVPLALIGLTGSILVFEHELEDLFGPEPYRGSTGPARPIAEIVAAAAAKAPRGYAPLFYTAPEEAGGAATVRLSPPGRGGPGGALQVLVDPASLAVVATRTPDNQSLLRRIFMLHANLLVRDRSGREVVGWFGVVMLTLGVSGLVLWWPRQGRWLAAFGVKRGARGLRLHRDLHGATGIWGLVVFIVVSFSGVYLAFPQSTGAVISSVLPARDLRASAQAMRVQPVPAAERIDVDAAVALARTAVPEGALRSIGLTGRPDQPYRVGLAPPGHEHGAPAITVFVDPWAKRVIEVRDPRRLTAGETVMAWQHALHAGAGLGWLWKILVFLSGLMPTVFAITGTSMWLLKRRSRRAAAARMETAAVPQPGE
jgi:uncharacterized iron-regulated membrane protein